MDRRGFSFEGGHAFVCSGADMHVTGCTFHRTAVAIRVLHDALGVPYRSFREWLRRFRAGRSS